MNFWPVQPGSTDMTSTRSTSSRNGRTAETGVPGLSTSPGRAPRRRIFRSSARGFGDDLDVERDDVRAGADEDLREPGRVGDHQVRVHRQRGGAPHGLDDVRPEGEVRDEMAVHDVHVMPVRAGALDRADGIAQDAQIARQNRRGNDAAHTDPRHGPWRYPNAHGKQDERTIDEH